MDDFELEDIQQPGFGRFAFEYLMAEKQPTSAHILQALWKTYVFHFPIGTDMVLNELIAYNQTVLQNNGNDDTLVLHVWKKLIQSAAEDVLAHPNCDDLLQNLIDFQLPEIENEPFIPLESFIGSLIQCHLSTTYLEEIVQWGDEVRGACCAEQFVFPIAYLEHISIPNIRQLFKYHLKSVNMWDELFDELKENEEDPTLTDSEYISNSCYKIYNDEVAYLKEIKEMIFPHLQPSLVEDIQKYLQLYFTFLQNHFSPALRKLMESMTSNFVFNHFKYINIAKNPNEEYCNSIDIQLRQAASSGLRSLLETLKKLIEKEDIEPLHIKFPVLKAELEAIGIEFDGRKGFSQQNYSAILNSIFQPNEKRTIG